MLDLSRCDIGNEGFEYIASALSNNQDLESVDLSDNHLDKACSQSLQNLLLYSSLTHLNLSWNSLYDTKLWKALVDGLKKNETLRSLNLSWNALEERCVPHLYNLLLHSQNIEKLNLSCKYIRFLKMHICINGSTHTIIKEIKIKNHQDKKESFIKNNLPYLLFFFFLRMAQFFSTFIIYIFHYIIKNEIESVIKIVFI